MRRFDYILLLMSFALTVQAAQAQNDSVSVKLVTLSPGDEVFSVFGHSEVRVTWEGNDLYFNYGVFDFDEPNFLLKFVLGNADYMCVAMPKQFAHIGLDGRRMVEQDLNLTQEQAIKVRNHLLNNIHPLNSKYRYKYLGDNCATRTRDILENFTDSLQYPAMADTVTYRDMLSYCTRNFPWENFGIDLLLGSDVDTVITIRQQMFMPMAMMKVMADATVMRDGKRVPLVTATHTEIEANDVVDSINWVTHPLTIALIFLALVTAVTIADLKRHTVTRWLDFGVCTVYSMAGSILFFLMFVCDREATFPNYNALWVNMFYFIPLALMWSRRTRKALRYYYMANGLVVALTIIAWPVIPQVANVAAFPLMIVPVLRAIAHMRAK